MQYSTNGGWLLALLRTLHAAGLDHEGLLAREGLSFDEVRRADVRVPVRVMTRLWQQARVLSDDEGIGLRVAEYVRATTFGPLSAAVYAAPDLATALDVLARYCSVFSGAALWWTRKHADRTELLSLAREPVADEVIDAAMAGILKMLRDISRPELTPVSILLHRPEPANSDPWNRVYGTTVQFQLGVPAVMALRHEDLTQPLFGHNVELFNSCVGMLESALASLRHGPITSFVRTQVIIGLQDNEIGIDSIAASLRMSPQTLRRRLAAEQQVFASLVDNVRQEIADRYLTQSLLPISEVSRLLGFENPSSFSRACRRWYKAPPSSVRKSGQRSRVAASPSTAG